MLSLTEVLNIVQVMTETGSVFHGRKTEMAHKLISH